MKKFLKFKLLPFLIFIILKLLYLSYRKNIKGEVELLKEKGNILVFWHSKMLPIIPFLGKRKIVALVSMSEDGELISNVLKRFGYIMVRGSTSRGGAKAVVKLLKKLKEGNTVAITPDGPRGPSRNFQKGALILSFKTGKKIIPLSYKSSKSHFFNSWDRFELPLPFSRIEIIIGKPYIVKNSEDDFSEDKINMEKILNALEK